MHGNYRHHYLLSPATSAGSQSASSTPAAGSQSASRLARQQHQMASSNFNGLPASSAPIKLQQQASYAPPRHQQHQHHHRHQAQESQLQQQQPADRLIDSQRVNGRYFADQRQFMHQQQVRASNAPPNGSRHQHQQLPAYGQPLQHPANQRQAGDDELGGDGPQLANGHQNRELYASQLRNSKLQHNFQQLQPPAPGRPFPAGPMQQQQQQARASGSQQSPTQAGGSQQQQQYRKNPAAAGQREPADGRSLHVNFNRGNQASGADEDEGDSRKKKYLTAKYGQQQMNLIKKRLKIEMWLCEQLKELAKGSQSEDELEEIDIDLDQLLDMDDDDTRRRWLKKTLEPFEDLPSHRVNKFIDDVLEQSKLL